MLRVEQLERRVLADRQALLSRGVTEGLPTLEREQEAFDDWLLGEPPTVAAMTPEQLERHEELVALGVA